MGGTQLTGTDMITADPRTGIYLIRYIFMPIDSITLTGTDLRVSRACFGTMTFGDQTSESQAARMVDSCIDYGINFFDTANMYQTGLSEDILGRILTRKRERVVLALGEDRRGVRA